MTNGRVKTLSQLDTKALSLFTSPMLIAPSTAASFNGQGAVWTKIYQSGLVNPSAGQWATDIINTSGGKHSFNISSSLPAEEYLIRAELIALHTASSYPGAQFYIGCAQVKITGGGSANPPKIALPGAYKGSDPGSPALLCPRLTP